MSTATLKDSRSCTVIIFLSGFGSCKQELYRIKQRNDGNTFSKVFHIKAVSLSSWFKSDNYYNSYDYNVTVSSYGQSHDQGRHSSISNPIILGED